MIFNMNAQQKQQYKAGKRYAEKQQRNGRRSPDDNPINDGTYWLAGYHSSFYSATRG